MTCVMASNGTPLPRAGHGWLRKPAVVICSMGANSIELAPTGATLTCTTFVGEVVHVVPTERTRHFPRGG